MIYIGIDPGISGAAAIIHPTEGILFHDCPLLPKQGKFNRHDSAAIGELLRYYSASYTAIVVIERVRFDSRDTTHKGSAETLVRTHEAWLTALAIYGIETHDLEVPIWRKLAGCNGLGTDEKSIVAYACRLFPQANDQLKRRSGRAKAGYVYDHNKAEALLMAHAARKIAAGEAVA